MNAVTEKQLLAIYDEVDREVAAHGPRCEASGRCCRFTEYGHVLYLSKLEAELLLKHAPAYSGPVTPDFCPFQVEKLCTARQMRPLGCRVYFCDPAYQETAVQLMEKYIAKLKAIVIEQKLEWLYAPLHAFLNDAIAHRGEANGSPLPPSSQRMELPIIPNEVK